MLVKNHSGDWAIVKGRWEIKTKGKCINGYNVENNEGMKSMCSSLFTDSEHC